MIAVRARRAGAGVSLVAGLALAAIACAERAGGGADDGATIVLPATEPGIRGTITRIEPGVGAAPSSVLVEETPGGLDSGGNKAMLRVPAETRIYRRTREGIVPGTFAELKAGMRVSGWFEGPVMESFPLQGTAGALVIEDQ